MQKKKWDLKKKKKKKISQTLIIFNAIQFTEMFENGIF